MYRSNCLHVPNYDLDINMGLVYRLNYLRVQSSELISIGDWLSSFSKPRSISPSGSLIVASVFDKTTTKCYPFSISTVAFNIHLISNSSRIKQNSEHVYANKTHFCYLNPFLRECTIRIIIVCVSLCEFDCLHLWHLYSEM
jgi:hypothetical protein